MIPVRTSVEVDEIPGAVIGLIVANLAVFLVQIGLPESLHQAFINQNALLPARYTQPGFAHDLGLDPHNYLPLLTNTFMHAGWLHLIVNMWTLWLFGAPVEARVGAPRFVLFYLACGAVASLAHFAFNFESRVPALGASGAIAGVLGGYTLIYPRAKVVLLTPVLFFPVAIPLPAVVYTLIWFALQVAQGIAELAAPGDTAGIAWWAHVGGFVAGLLRVVAVGAPQRKARLIGAPRGRVREVGAPRVGVVRIGDARRAKLRPSPPARAPRPAAARQTITADRPRKSDRARATDLLGRTVARVVSEIEKAGAKTETTKTAPDAAAPTRRRGRWG